MNRVRKSYKELIIFVSLIMVIIVKGEIGFTELVIDDNIDGAGGVFSRDMDNDGDQDILLASTEDHMVILWRSSLVGDSIVWDKLVIGTSVYSAHSVYSADFDNDGDQDIVAAQYHGALGILYWRNNLIEEDSLFFTKDTISSTFVDAHEVYAHDLDSDGDKDILAASSNPGKISWWENRGGDPLKWIERDIYTSSFNGGNSQIKSVSVGDFNCDGDSDVVAAILLENTIITFESSRDSVGNLIWKEDIVENNFRWVHRVEVVDLDNDGDDDILGAAYDDIQGKQIGWWRNDGVDSNGDLIWSDQQVIGENFNHGCIATAVDLDGDGLLDVAATSQKDNRVAWWKQSVDSSGDISWEERVVVDYLLRPWPLCSGDLDGDGDMDLISASSYEGSKSVCWYKNSLITSIDERVATPESSILKNNYPNPFNPSTTISFNLESSSYIELKIYNLKGEVVRDLLQGRYQQGSYSTIWNGEDSSGRKVGSGRYFYRLISDGREETKMMIMVK